MGYTVKSVFEKEAVEMRKVYCNTLMELAETDPRICVLDADLVGSSGVKPFFQKFPDRAIDCGIQEANMIGVAAGLSAAGMVPFGDVPASSPNKFERRSFKLLLIYFHNTNRLFFC